MSKLVVTILYLAFFFHQSNLFAGILGEDILSSESIERLQAELKEIDGITTTPTLSKSSPTVGTVEDSVGESSSGVKKAVDGTDNATSGEQRLEETSDYINLDQYF
jgi:hypothetical protein